MKIITPLIIALAATATCSQAQTTYHISSQQMFLPEYHRTAMSDNARAMSASGVFDIPGPTLRQNTLRKAPNPLGGQFTDWELLGKARFNAELGVVNPCDVDVWYCTTDPSGMGMGVDSYHLEGVFTEGLRIAAMPFIDYTNIGNTDTGVRTDKDQPIMIDELSNHYNVGMSSSIEDLSTGLIKLGSLYYVNDPDVTDNVIAYGIETVQLEGDFKDYRVSFEVAGETRDGTRLKTNLSFVDATNVKVKCYPGALTYPQILQNANAQHTDASLTNVSESGSQYFDLNGDGAYTVIATFDKGDEWEYLSGTYDYDSRWEDYGTADFTDDYLASYYDEFPVATASGIKVQRHKVNTGHYRLVNPYSTTDTWTKIYPRLQYAEPEVNSFLVINAETADKVYIYINPVDITYDDGVRMVCGSAAHYNLINDRTEEDITDRGYWGKIETADGVSTVTFPARTLMMRPINSEAPLFANNNGAFKVVITAAGAGIDDISAGQPDAVATEAYNLAGVKVSLDNAPAGIYLVKYSDGTLRKIIK